MRYANYSISGCIIKEKEAFNSENKMPLVKLLFCFMLSTPSYKPDLQFLILHW